MPFMKRSEIIKQYGFDPLKDTPPGGVSVVPMNKPQGADESDNPASVINVDEDRTQNIAETPSASPTANLAAGAIKGALSDPFTIYGLGAGVLDYATDVVARGARVAGKAVGLDTEPGEKIGFADKLYEDGGLDDVKSHLQAYAEKVRGEHPQWTREQILQEVDRYRMTDQFFDYNISRMRPGLSRGMREAWEINKAFGVDKRPDQETTVDIITQALGSAGIPNPLSVFGGYAARAASRAGISGAARAAGRVADALVVPGTELGEHFVPRVGIGVGVNAGVDQALRVAQEDPNVLRGGALWDFSKQAMRMPDETPLTPPPDTGIVPTATPPTEGGSYDNREVGTAVGAGVGALAAGVLGSRALRRFNPPIRDIPTNRAGIDEFGNIDVDPARAGRTLEEKSAVVREQQGLEPDWNEDSEWRKFVDTFGLSVEREAPLYNWIESVGGRPAAEQAKTIFGTILSPAARDRQYRGWFETQGRELWDAAQELPTDTFNTFLKVNVARNEEYARALASQRAWRSLSDAQQALQANPNSRSLQDAVREAQDRVNAIAQDLPESRHAITHVSTADLRSIIRDGVQVPGVAQLEQRLQNMNRQLDRMEVQAGSMTPAEATQRARTPWHSSLFGIRPGTHLNAEQRRDIGFAFSNPNARPDLIMSPVQSFYARAAQAHQNAALARGYRELTNLMRSLDPNERMFRRVGPAHGPTPGPSFGNFVSVVENGVETRYQVARADVARAMQMAPLQMGAVGRYADAGRKWVQHFLTNPIVNHIQPFFSSAYDATTRAFTLPPGRAYGYLGKWLQIVGGNNRYSGPIIDLAARLDPSWLVAVPIQAAKEPFQRLAGVIGRDLMDNAVRAEGLDGLINSVPGLAAAQHAVGEALVRTYMQSALYAMRRANAEDHSTLIRNAYNYQSAVDEVTDRFSKGRRDAAGYNAWKMLSDGYKALTDSIANSAKHAYMAQNLEILKLRTGARNVDEIPIAQLRRLAEETRRSSGDMQAVPTRFDTPAEAGYVPKQGAWRNANALMRYGVNNAIVGLQIGGPYVRIAFNSLRHVMQAARANPAGFGLSLGTLSSYYLIQQDMLEEMGLKDWYYEKLTPQDRVGIMMLPSPEALLEKARTGVFPKADPLKPDANLHKFKLSAEIVPFVESAKAAYEAMGWIDRGANRGNTNISQDFGYSVGNVLGTGNFPIVNQILLPLTGQSIDFMGGMRGRNVISEAYSPRGMGINTGSTPMGIPAWAADFTRMNFGVIGNLAMAMGDVGVTAYRKGTDAAGSLSRMLETGQAEWQRRYPSVPGLWKADDKIKLTTPISERIKKTMDANELLDKQWRLDLSDKNTIKGTYNLRGIAPEALKMVAVTHELLSKGDYKKLANAVNLQRNNITQIEFDRHKYSEQEYREKREAAVRKLHAWQDRQVKVIDLYEDILQRRFSGIFRQEGDLEPTIESVSQIVRKYAK